MPRTLAPEGLEVAVLAVAIDLPDRDGAGAWALISSLGNFAGYLGPIVVDYPKDPTRACEAGLYVLAAAALFLR